MFDKKSIIALKGQEKYYDALDKDLRPDQRYTSLRVPPYRVVRYKERIQG